MSGRLTSTSSITDSKHNHLVITLNNENFLVFNDPRRFGLFTLIHNADINSHTLFKDLGIEPLTKAFNAVKLQSICHKRHSNIKSVLMNANLIVGVGNIYANESLFLAGINPLRKASSLTVNEIQKLTTAIKKVLEDAILSGGSSLKDYVTSSGEAGYFQHNFKVYDRFNKTCYECSHIIEKNKIAGRSTFYCKHCQK